MLKILVCACMALAIVPALAAAAEARNYSLGGLEVIALADTDPGVNRPGDPRLLVGLTAADAARFLSAPDAMKNSVNCFIVKNGREVILFDAGMGGGHGLLPGSLAAAGIAPDSIDAVVITHFHGDHIGGLVKDGRAVFPRARLMVPRVEVEANPQAAKTFMAAYAGRLNTFEWNQPVADGVVAVDASGHTPGHTAFLLENGGDKLMIAGDLVHFGAVQLPLPDVAVTYDTDTVKAIAARKRWFDKAANEGYVVATMHLPFPGIGTLRKDGGGYVFAPQQ